jgi:hypothetical protein
MSPSNNNRPLVSLNDFKKGGFCLREKHEGVAGSCLPKIYLPPVTPVRYSPQSSRARTIGKLCVSVIANHYSRFTNPIGLDFYAPGSPAIHIEKPPFSRCPNSRVIADNIASSRICSHCHSASLSRS